MITIILSVLALSSAAVHIYVDRKGLRRYAYVFKPLTMGLLLLIAVLAARDNISVYGLAIIVGIVFSRDLLEIFDKEQPPRTAGEIAHDAYFVPGTKQVSELLKEMQATAVQSQPKLSLTYNTVPSDTQVVLLDYRGKNG